MPRTRFIPLALTLVLAGPFLSGCKTPPPRPPISDTRAELPVGHAHAHAHHTEALPVTESADPTEDAERAELLPGLGTLSYPVTTSVPEAQQFFDQGLRLAYAFNHAEARRAFRKAQLLDPGCALCYWGEALVLGPNINAPMDSSALPPALHAVAKARDAAADADPREQALIEAVARRYAGPPDAGRPELDRAYAEAMADLAARYPDDDQIAVLYAEALMNLSPWDYWEAGGARARPATRDLLRELERVLRRNPGHPGAIHYYIHAVEASKRPERAEPYADRLGALMPGAGHLVHMPSHIYYRLGRYQDAIDANRAAIAADEAYFRRAGKRPGIYADGYYPHNVHLLMTAAQMAGDGPLAIEAAEKLSRTVSDRSARTAPWIQAIKAAPYFAHAQFSPADDILALPDPGPAMPYVQGAWHYARGLASLWQDDDAGVEREARAIESLRKRSDWTPLTSAGVPAPEVLAIAERVLRARQAQSAGDLEKAETRLAEAVTIQDRLPYMEPPFWYYPVRQSLGAVRLQAGDTAAAKADFQAALKEAPNNVWALRGLKEAEAQAAP
jgi:tetratricopeptide (TPR) repeat protein